jgi:predicted nucleotidyltransferase
MNSRIIAVLRHVSRCLGDTVQRWALVGGLAVSARTEPRFTRDIDVVVAVASDSDAEALIRRLMADGFSVATTLEHDVLHRLATVRLVPPGESLDGIVVDLLFASSGIEPDICLAAEPTEVVEGLTIPVARTGHLLAQKVLARSPDRLQDDLDIRALLAEADEGELVRCRRALESITSLRAHRGKDLIADFEAAMAKIRR